LSGCHLDSVTFVALGETSGIHVKYLRCVLCLILAWFVLSPPSVLSDSLQPPLPPRRSLLLRSCLLWTYDDVDGARTFLHPLRRHFFAAVTFTHLHLPLYAALVLVSVAMQSFVQDDTPTQVGFFPLSRLS
jgi:hypothetical protein